MTTTLPLRFGLVGTGPWAQKTHAPAIAATPGVQLAGIWGRDHARATALGEQYGVPGFSDFGDLLAVVDAVSFAVPPDVQCTLALRAAVAGKHLLLEKPVATTDGAADELAAQVRASGVATVVFFTARFRPGVREWLARIAELDGWICGSAVWLSPGLLAPSPSPWRVSKGGLWDLGPHAVSLLWAALGPVAAVSADRGYADLTHLVLHHASGATSTVTLSQSAPRPTLTAEVLVWGEAGRFPVPKSDDPAAASLQVALTELAVNARSGELRHGCDVNFGRDVGRVLTVAERQLGSAHAGAVPGQG